MGTLLNLLLMGMASNLDNLSVGIAYGIRRIKLPPLPNLVIAAIAFAFTYASVWAGTYTGRFLSNRAANAIGAGLLIGVGLWVILAQRRRPEAGVPRPASDPPLLLDVWQEPEEADVDRSGVISVGESVVLGVALSVNCFTNGFAAGLWNLGALPTAMFNAVLSYMTLWGGAWLGARYGARRLGNKATYAAGCMLILLGIHQLS